MIGIMGTQYLTYPSSSTMFSSVSSSRYFFNYKFLKQTHTRTPLLIKTEETISHDAFRNNKKTERLKTKKPPLVIAHRRGL